MDLKQVIWKVRKRIIQNFFPDRLAEAWIDRLRERGVRIGEGCLIYTEEFLNEPYLVNIGDNVGVSVGTRFITHDGAFTSSGGRDSWRAIFGRISVGSNTFIGAGCTLLPGTVIGRDCVVGAGSVVRGTVPDGMLVIGNPASVVMSARAAGQLAARHAHLLDVSGLSAAARERAIRAHFGIDGGDAVGGGDDRGGAG